MLANVWVARGDCTTIWANWGPLGQLDQLGQLCLASVTQLTPIDPNRPQLTQSGALTVSAGRGDVDIFRLRPSPAVGGGGRDCGPGLPPPSGETHTLGL